MKTVGIDVGFDTIKAAVMDDGKLLAKAACDAGCVGRDGNIDKLYSDVLAEAGLSSGDVDKVVATGIGKFSVKFAADHIADAVAIAKAAKFFFDGAVSVVDIGADKTHVVTLAGDGISEVVQNQKCMAGLGLLLDVMANRLGYTLDEVGAFGAGADGGVFVNDGCPVFAELDSLEALNKGKPRDKVMGAVINTVVYRLNSILRDKVMPDTKATVLLGGVSQNAAVVSGLKARSGVEFIIPEDAVFGGAIGCALIAAAS
jgi:predicted CoA-substrate-specific enzyme activase